MSIRIDTRKKNYVQIVRLFSEIAPNIDGVMMPEFRHISVKR
jgi:hypothetical protein